MECVPRWWSGWRWMGRAPLEGSVTCTYCKPPRAAAPLVATMDRPPAALLRLPSSTYPDVLDEKSGWSDSIDSSRMAESIQSWGTSRDIVGRGSS
jgi:hypothetical protein